MTLSSLGLDLWLIPLLFRSSPCSYSQLIPDFISNWGMGILLLQVQGPDGGEPEFNFFHFQWKTSYSGDGSGDGGDGDGDGRPAISGGWIFIIIFDGTSKTYLLLKHLRKERDGGCWWLGGESCLESGTEGSCTFVGLPPCVDSAPGTIYQCQSFIPESMYSSFPLNKLPLGISLVWRPCYTIIWY